MRFKKPSWLNAVSACTREAALATSGSAGNIMLSDSDGASFTSVSKSSDSWVNKSVCWVKLSASVAKAYNEGIPS